MSLNADAVDTPDAHQRGILLLVPTRRTYRPLKPVTRPEPEPPNHRRRDIDVTRGGEVVGPHEAITFCQNLAQT